MKKLILSILFLLLSNQAFAAIAFVNATNGAANAVAQNIDLPAAATAIAVTSGNLLIAEVFATLDGGSVTATSVTDSVGNTYTLAAAGSTQGGYHRVIYYCANPTGGASVTITGHSTQTTNNSRYSDILVFQFSGMDTSSPYDTTAGIFSGSGSNNVTSGTFSTSIANEVVFFTETNGSLGPVAGPIAGTNGIVPTGATGGGSGNRFGGEYRILSSIGSGITANIAGGSGDTLYGYGAAFMGAAAATSTPIRIILNNSQWNNTKLGI